jgi:hypothetical protein
MRPVAVSVHVLRCMSVGDTVITGLTTDHVLCQSRWRAAAERQLRLFQSQSYCTSQSDEAAHLAC